VWEEANSRGLLSHIHIEGSVPLVGLSPRGAELLSSRRSLSFANGGVKPNIVNSVSAAPSPLNR
jgi:hypothetical protein